MITKSIIDSQTYLTATARGTEYTLSKLGDAWFVSSHRIALGRRHIGGGKHYANLGAVADGCKAFGGYAALLQALYGVDQSAEIAA